MRIGYNTWSMARVPYQEFIPGLAEIGYTAIAISVVPGYTISGQWTPNAGALDGLTADDRRSIRQQFIERGLALPSVIGNQSFFLEGQDNARAMERLARTVDLCVELALPGQALPTMNTGVAGKPEDLDVPTKEQALVDRLGELTEHARERGVTVCIEPHVGGAIESLARAEWVVKTIDSPHLRLDFDVSHFEVQAIPMAESVARMAPLASAIEIKDQRTRPLDVADGWIEGNGSGECVGPDGQALRYQFLLGGEGDFPLAEFLRLVNGTTDAVAFEASVQCQARPDYDGLAAAARTYQWMVEGWRVAGVAC